MYEWILLVVVLIIIVYFWRRSRESFDLPYPESASALQSAYAVTAQVVPANAARAYEKNVEIRDAWRSIIDMLQANIAAMNAEISVLQASLNATAPATDQVVSRASSHTLSPVGRGNAITKINTYHTMIKDARDTINDIKQDKLPRYTAAINAYKGTQRPSAAPQQSVAMVVSAAPRRG